VVNIAGSQKVERAETNDAGMTVRYLLPRTGPQKSLLRPRYGFASPSTTATGPRMPRTMTKAAIDYLKASGAI
jgi:hypothetical protein